MTARKLLHRWLLRAALSTTVLGAALLAAPAVWASFDEVSAGARAAGMADAQTALADDASAATNNPAGLIQIGDTRVTTEFGEYARGLSDGSRLGSSYIGFVRPVRVGQTVLSAAYRSFKATDILEERTYLLGLGRRLRIEPLGWAGVWSAGINLKMLERAFVADGYAANALNDAGAGSGRVDPLLSGGGKTTAISMDAGVLYQFGRRLDSSLGLMVINVNQPDISKGSGDRAPQIAKIGAAQRTKWGALTAEVRRARRLAQRPDTDIAFGVERNFRLKGPNAVTLRGGYGEGSRGYQTITAGAAYHFGRFSFDYAFSFPIGNLSDTDGHQRVGFSVRFGSGPAKSASLTPLTQRETPRIQVMIISSTETAAAATLPRAEVVESIRLLEKNRADLEKLEGGASPSVDVLQREIEALKKATGEPAAPTIETPAAPTMPPPPAPVALPARLKAPVVTPAKAGVKPANVGSPDAEREWQFYREAVEREVSDYEKIEVLEGMKTRLGAGQAGPIDAELKKLRKRVPKATRRGQ